MVYMSNDVESSGEPEQDLDSLPREQLIQRVRQLEHTLSEAKEQLEVQKITDTLTGLANRDYFFASLTRLCWRAKRFEQIVCMALVDIDDFHVVNEQYGTLAGDLVLTGIADVLKVVVRGYDLLARFGEDEFAIAIDNGAPELASRIGQRIRKSVASNPFCINDRIIPVTVTVGVVTAKADLLLQRPDAIVRLAVEAVETARRKGRNQTQWLEMTAPPADAGLRT